MYIAKSRRSVATHNNSEIILDELLYVPEASKNLLSVYSIHLGPNQAHIANI